MTDQFEAIKAEMARKQQIAKDQVEKGRQTIMELMHKHDIQIVKVRFAGSGDDGCIEDIAVVHSPDQEAWEGEPLKDRCPELHEHIETYCDNYLDGCGVDWYNNEGGQGEFLFDTSQVPHVFECTVEYNIVTTEVGHYASEVM